MSPYTGNQTKHSRIKRESTFLSNWEKLRPKVDAPPISPLEENEQNLHFFKLENFLLSLHNDLALHEVPVSHRL